MDAIVNGDASDFEVVQRGGLSGRGPVLYVDIMGSFCGSETGFLFSWHYKLTK